jgi:hypothetical protein
MMLRELNTMVTIKSAQIKTPGLSSLVESKASSSPVVCTHRRPASSQFEGGKKTGTEQMIRVIELLIELLVRLFGGKNEASSTQQAPGSMTTSGTAPAGTPGTTTAPEGQNAKGSSLLDKLGEAILGSFSSAIGKLFG